MPRCPRSAPGGLVYHVLNRSVGRITLFRTDKDFLAFQNLLLGACDKRPMRLLAWCVMSTHWHFVVWPKADGQLTDFFRWLTHAHAMRWRVAHHSVGYGPLYQGRFKSFPIQTDEHFLTVCRYVERNALSAGLVRRGEEWPWSSLHARENGPEQLQRILCPWPVNCPRNWVEAVNQPLTERELEKVRISLARSRPYGDETWTGRTAARLHLEHTLRAEGRPKKEVAVVKIEN